MAVHYDPCVACGCVDHHCRIGRGGIKGVGIVLNVSAQAALGKAGLAAAGSAATLAAVKGITVTAAVLSSAKIVGSAIGSLTMIASSATRAADHTALATILGAAGGTLSVSAFLFGGRRRSEPIGRW